MAKSEELKIVSVETSSLEEDGFFFVADKQTRQMSFEPLEDIFVSARTATLAYFSAQSLGRRVRGFIGVAKDGTQYGEVDFVTPLRAGEDEVF